MRENQIDLYFEVADDLSAAEHDSLVSAENVLSWLNTAIQHLNVSTPIELTVRAISKAESQALNFAYRAKDKPTNVLSFAADTPDFVESDYIGDIAICVAVLTEEAQTQNKTNKAHWAHLCVHGLLHLLGYDHIHEEHARIMETLETSILASLGIDDPYQDV
jgi:probable rRNA maturation factor